MTTADPRKTYFSVKSCLRGQQQQQNQQANRKTFLDGLANVGNLEVLNDVGYGGVGEGLRVLTSVSDSVRTGESVVPGREGTNVYNTTRGEISNIALESTDQGATAVIDSMGLGSALQAVGELNPAVANRAYGEAKQIFQRVKQGNFNITDIPNSFQALQNLEILARGIFNSNDRLGNNTRDIQICTASPYAVDLISHAPKFQFLFAMDVEFAPAYQQFNDISSTTSFVIKRSTRPVVEFEYEDINMYNFHTRVPKKVNYPPMTMTFYDDNKNAAHLFYTAYMRAISPIANMINGQPQTNFYEQNSMNFERSGDTSTFTGDDPTLAGYSSSLGPLLDNTKSMISRIRLYHIFDYGRLMNIYNFYNPRILSFNPSELTMSETGDGCEYEFQFAADGLFIEPGYSIREGGDKNIVEITSNRGTAQFKIDPIFADDAEDSDNSQQKLAPSAQQQASGAGGQLDSLRSQGFTGTDVQVPQPPVVDGPQQFFQTTV